MPANDFENQRFGVEDVGSSNAPTNDPRFAAPNAAPPASGGGCFFRGCLIGCGVAIVLAIGAGVAGYYLVRQNFSMDPEESLRRLKAEVPCEVPAGYKVGFSMSVPALMKMFFIVPAGMQFDNQKKVDENVTMMFIISAPTLSANQLEAQMKANRPHQDADGEEEKEEQIDMKFGAKTLKVTKSTSKDKNGRSFVTYSTVIRKGVLACGIAQPERFDLKAFESLIQSIVANEPEKRAEKEPAAPEKKE